MDDAGLRLVRQRARERCEYCQFPEAYSRLPFEIDHVIARKHGGNDAVTNLCLACFACNHHKGPNIAGIDPHTGKIVRLFHPRRHKWQRRFRWNGPQLVGRTPLGRATVAVLEINRTYRAALRQALIIEGVFPPT